MPTDLAEPLDRFHSSVSVLLTLLQNEKDTMLPDRVSEGGIEIIEQVLRIAEVRYAHPYLALGFDRKRASPV